MSKLRAPLASAFLAAACITLPAAAQAQSDMLSAMGGLLHQVTDRVKSTILPAAAPAAPTAPAALPSSAQPPIAASPPAATRRPRPAALAPRLRGVKVRAPGQTDSPPPADQARFTTLAKTARIIEPPAIPGILAPEMFEAAPASPNTAMPPIAAPVVAPDTDKVYGVVGHPRFATEQEWMNARLTYRAAHNGKERVTTPAPQTPVVMYMAAAPSASPSRDDLLKALSGAAVLAMFLGAATSSLGRGRLQRRVETALNYFPMLLSVRKGEREALKTVRNASRTRGDANAQEFPAEATNVIRFAPKSAAHPPAPAASAAPTTPLVKTGAGKLIARDYNR